VVASRPAATALAERYPQVVDAPAPFQRARRRRSRRRSGLERRPAERPAAAELAADLESIVDALPRPRLGLFRPGGRRRLQRLA
jgi:hypothetical protein